MTAPVAARPRRSRRAAALAVLALVVCGLVGAAFLNLVVRRQVEEERRQARELGTQCTYRLEKQLDQLAAAASPITALLRQRVELTDFAGVAAGILKSSPGLFFVVLAPGGRVSEIYPADAAGIESELEAQLGPAELAEPALAEPRLSDPVRLADGDLAVFGVDPVVVEEPAGPRRWGFAAAALRVDELERSIGLDELSEQGYDFHLSGAGTGSGRRRVVRRSTEFELSEPLELPIEVRGASWTLSLAPRDGWTGWASYRRHMAFVGILALLSALLTHELARQPERLRHQVDQRSTHLRKAKRRLDDERRQRAEAEARETWRNLDRFGRMALVAAGRPSDPEGASERSVVDAVARALEAVGMEYRSEEIRSAIYRLEEHGLLGRDKVDRLRVEKPIVFALPETSKRLTEIARDSMERIGPYRIKHRLGGGGMGEVFEAENVDDGTTAAVKLLYPHTLEDEEHRQRFEREGNMVARLSHPNVVRLLDRGEHLNRLYIAMELIEGETLDSRIRRGPVPLEEALAVLWDIGQALAALHDLGVVHRDVKTSNVIRSSTGRSVLLDFGLASRMTSQALTRSNTVLGTVPYMAPERLQGKRGTPHVDVWAAGLLLYEMLAGRLPWKNPEELTLVNEILTTRNLEVRRRLHKKAPGDVLDLLEDTLAISPEDRLPDGNAIVARLTAITGWSTESFDAEPISTGAHEGASVSTAAKTALADTALADTALADTALADTALAKTVLRESDKS